METGLCSVEICGLRLGDVDRKHNVIHIVQSKTQRPLNLPLRTSYTIDRYRDCLNSFMNYLEEVEHTGRKKFLFAVLRKKRSNAISHG